jgi:hypothetical protein
MWFRDAGKKRWERGFIQIASYEQHALSHRIIKDYGVLDEINARNDECPDLESGSGIITPSIIELTEQSVP